MRITDHGLAGVGLEDAAQVSDADAKGCGEEAEVVRTGEVEIDLPA